MSRRTRLWLVAFGVLAALVVLVPPLSTLARRYEVLAAMQFGVLAILVPALVTVGAPWWLLKLAVAPELPAPPDPGHPDRRDDPEPNSPSATRLPVENARAFDRLADGRRRHPELVRAVGFVALDVLAMVLWRTPAAGNALQRHPWLVLIETVVLVPLGVGLWLECIESPPLEPRSTRPWRAALATIAMWSVWIVAYLVAMSHTSWYVAFNHSTTSLSASADRQLSSAVLWFIAAACFMPVVFVNLILWLRSEEEDPDTELHQLLREEHRRAVPAPPVIPPQPAPPSPPTTSPGDRPTDG